jgi:hypothetical protein
VRPRLHTLFARFPGVQQKATQCRPLRFPPDSLLTLRGRGTHAGGVIQVGEPTLRPAQQPRQTVSPLPSLRLVSRKHACVRWAHSPPPPARRLLHQYVQAHAADVSAVYFVAGWTHGAAHLVRLHPAAYADSAARAVVSCTRDSQQHSAHTTPASTARRPGSLTERMSTWAQGAEGRLRSMELVAAERLDERRAALAAVTCVHVYSVQRRLPYPPSALLDADKRHTAELLASPADAVNCVRDNRWSHVRCPQVCHLSPPLPACGTTAGRTCAALRCAICHRPSLRAGQPLVARALPSGVPSVTAPPCVRVCEQLPSQLH